MKRTNKFLVLALLAVATVFVSCSKDGDPVPPTQQEIEAKIVGKWKNVMINGEPVLTNNRIVMTYASDKTATISMSRYFNAIDHYVWDNQMQYKWSVEGNTICNKPTGVGITQFRQVLGIEDNRITDIFTKIIDADGEEHIKNLNLVEQRVTADYSQDILGLWEGVEMTGDETYGNAEARILYHADGTYTYYQKHADVWVPSENVDNEYNVDGDWLATRWRPEEGADYNYEWWDIDEIKDGIMKWSALRERADGSRYTTTFTWKKVNAPIDDKLLEKIMGNWNNIGTTFILFKNGKVVDTIQKYATSEQTYSFFDGNRMRLIQLDDDGNPEVIFGGPCTVKGSTITVVYEESKYPTIIGMEEDFYVASLNDEFLEFGFYHEGKAYVADEDTPAHDHYLQLTRYQRK